MEALLSGLDGLEAQLVGQTAAEGMDHFARTRAPESVAGGEILNVAHPEGRGTVYVGEQAETQSVKPPRGTELLRMILQ